jgi:hypothetical protein
MAVRVARLIPSAVEISAIDDLPSLVVVPCPVRRARFSNLLYAGAGCATASPAVGTVSRLVRPYLVR